MVAGALPARAWRNATISESAGTNTPASRRSGATSTRMRSDEIRAQASSSRLKVRRASCEGSGRHSTVSWQSPGMMFFALPPAIRPTLSVVCGGPNSGSASTRSSSPMRSISRRARPAARIAGAPVSWKALVAPGREARGCARLWKGAVALGAVDRDLGEAVALVADDGDHPRRLPYDRVARPQRTLLDQLLRAQTAHFLIGGGDQLAP